MRYVEVGDMIVDATPVFHITDGGEVSVNWAPNGTLLKNMILLYDSQEQPVNAANEYLIHCKSIEKSQDLHSLAKGLLHFFNFLENENLSWDDMPRPKHLRPLYRFCNYLQSLHDEVDPVTGKRHLSSSTARSYRGAAIGMYKYWLGHGYVFQREPCQFFEASIHNISILGHINRFIRIQQTDLKIIARDKINRTSLPNHLRPLLKEKRPELQSLLSVIQTGRGYTKVRGKYIAKSISTEVCLAVLLALYTGMRRKEVLSFSSALVHYPQPGAKAFTIMIGPENYCHTKNSQSGEIKIPAWLMQLLARYKNTGRYKQRLSRYLQRFHQPLACQYPPLLLNNSGQPYNENSLNARWGEIRNAICIDHGIPEFSHKFHNLRSTYATYLTIALLQLVWPDDHPGSPNTPVMSRDQVEAEVQARLRHSSPQTTALYVKYWEDHYLERQSDRIHQEGLDQIYGDDNATKIWDSLLTHID
ncbi:tyrosine-type recombinase/integrase [Enterobacter mori]|uniref:tyrosine-type recombinase/integrase n=1 Tax=Enterobacter mori TaxID=539813 RepID=UPI003B83E8E5